MDACLTKISHPRAEKHFLFLSICAGGLHCLDAFILPINPQADISPFFFRKLFNLFHLEHVRGMLQGDIKKHIQQYGTWNRAQEILLPYEHSGPSR